MNAPAPAPTNTPGDAQAATRGLHSPVPCPPPPEPRCGGELRCMDGKTAKDRYQCRACEMIHVRKGNLMNRSLSAGCPFPARDANNPGRSRGC